jgi:hypothetical protein
VAPLSSSRSTGTPSASRNASGGSTKSIAGVRRHRDDESRRKRAHELGRRGASDRRAAAHGDKDDVDGADRFALLRPQPRLAEVTEVAKAQAVEREAEDRVRPACRSRYGVVLGGDGDHLADRRLEPSGRRAQDDGSAADGLDAVVVGVLVRD